ncbi:hypothetical protein ABS768_12230 [Flavobacterium sp. ST-75]|uniref:Uncharacterized protein n=1 Tax=Flavobacterium rhizophilum TaxID=3163296 RepID=A0ABW8YDI6_9FLAO
MTKRGRLIVNKMLPEMKYDLKERLISLVKEKELLDLTDYLNAFLENFVEYETRHFFGENIAKVDDLVMYTYKYTGGSLHNHCVVSMNRYMYFNPIYDGDFSIERYDLRCELEYVLDEAIDDGFTEEIKKLTYYVENDSFEEEKKSFLEAYHSNNLIKKLLSLTPVSVAIYLYCDT